MDDGTYFSIFTFFIPTRSLILYSYRLKFGITLKLLLNKTGSLLNLNETFMSLTQYSHSPENQRIQRSFRLFQEVCKIYPVEKSNDSKQ